MKFSTHILLSIISVLTSVNAAPVGSQPPQINFEVIRYGSENNTLARANRFSRKASGAGITVSLENEYSLYLGDIEIGTPGQKIKVDIDTGSSDLWVPGAGTQSTDGTYDHTKSSTYEKVQDGFQIGYGDGSSAFGDWAKETINIGGATVKGLEFGDATTQNVGQSILGVGFKGNEASAQSSDAFTYDNLPLQLKNQGVINKAAYSLYLNSAEATSGSILFGAIDQSKYSGELKTLDIQNIDDSGSQTDQAVAFFVNLDSITAGDNQFISQSYPALLDSGTTLIYAPQQVAQTIGEQYGQYDQQVGGYTIDCDATGDDFQFSFEDKTITVPFEDLVFNTQGQNGGGQCIIGVLSSGSDYYILGDGFLRSAYVYYNIEDTQIGIAQAQYNSGPSDIVLA